MKVKTAIKTAGLSFAGYALASMFADKIPLNPMASQLAGFAGAFLGTLVAPRRDRRAVQQTSAPKQNGTARAPETAGTEEQTTIQSVSVAASGSGSEHAQSAQPPGA